MRLPRSGFSEDPDVKSGTADWAGEDEILAHSYKPGDLWLGYHYRPTPEAAVLIDRLDAFEVALNGEEELDPLWRQKQISIGRQFQEHLSQTDRVEVGLGDDRHAVTKAGTRGGKGTTAIVNNLCLYPGSVICIDPKGENARLCRNRRGQGSEFCEGLGQTVAVLDPYGVSGTPLDERASLNPLDTLDIKDEQIIDRAAGIADMLFIRGSGDNAHFDDTARIFVKALILFVAFEYLSRSDRNLVTVHDLLMNGAVAQFEAEKAAMSEDEVEKITISAFDVLLELMLQNPERAEGTIAGAANMLLSMGDRERGSVLSTARRNLEFLERNGIRRTLVRSSFDLSALKSDPNGMTVFVCLPPQRMHDTARFLRLIIGLALENMYETEEPPATGHPVLCLLEEFASLRHMEVIEHAAGYAAGFGVKFWFIIQDITQLKRFYKEGWETFLGNAGMVQAFANSDMSTLEYLSKKVGQTEISQVATTMNTTRSATSSNPSDHERARRAFSLKDAAASFFDSKSTSEMASMSASDAQQVKLTALIQPDEIERVFRREELNQLLLIKGQRPFAIKRQNYFEGSRFLGLFDPDRVPFWKKDKAASVATKREAARLQDVAVLIEKAEQWIVDTAHQIDAAKRSARRR